MLYEFFTKYRNLIINFLYRHALKPIFFKMDPEDIHDKMISSGSFLGKSSIIRRLFSFVFDYKNPILSQKVLNMDFINPIGLSAGFDKNAELTDLLPNIGFGFIEIGSVTGEYCAGNQKPRLWRMPLSESLIVYYGLKNDGAEKVGKRLENKKHRIPLGINVAMTNCPNNLDINNAIEDFKKAFNIMKSHADYITINISCPNALGGQPFIKPENLENLLNILDKIETDKPRFIKLSPDLQKEEVDIILNILKNHKIHGIICSNLTKNRINGKIHQNENNITDKGGISGKVVRDLSDDLLKYIYQKEVKRFILIGVGGIFSAEDVYKKMRNGASLVQLITGMIFEGPSLISNINQDLAHILKRDGFKNIKEVIGIDANQD